ncbi:MAG: hypothetical protein ACI8ZM_000811 [Crocinitomix sp.]|jgi:hypothetical protein
MVVVPSDMMTIFIFNCKLLSLRIMKYLALVSILLIVSCQNSTETPVNNNPQVEEPAEITENNEAAEALDEFAALMEDLRTESDSIVESHKKSYTPFDGVNRKPDTAPLNFNTFSWENRFNYSFSETPNFERYEKDDHDSYTVRTLVDGVIYEIAVEDYEKLGADKIDAGFTKYIHEKFISNFGSEVKDAYELQTEDGVYGYASCYRYEMNERTYLGDLISFGFQDKMVRFSITAKGNYENASRAQEFVNAFVIL